MKEYPQALKPEAKQEAGNPYWKLKRFPTVDEARQQLDFYGGGVSFWRELLRTVRIVSGEKVDAEIVNPTVEGIEE